MLIFETTVVCDRPNHGKTISLELSLNEQSVFEHDLCMDVILPESLEARISPESAALHLAIGLYVTGETTLGQSAEVAHLSQMKFLRELGNRRIPIHYGAEELTEDLIAIDALSVKR